jgi:Plasmid pRiA4b ORF-3-like protein
MAKGASSGTCVLCGYRSSKAAMVRHISTCAAAHDVSKGTPTRLFHLRVEGSEAPMFWLDLEMKADATLSRLDHFLRDIWLECCGHLSAFRIDQTTYTIPVDDPFDDFQDDRSMIYKVGEILGSAGQRFKYEYDFGSTTYLSLRVMGTREGVIGRRLLRLLVRNDPPVWPCGICKQPATLVCPFCIYEREAFYCVAHSGRHECHEEDVWLPVVNSPRMGTCGYTGDAWRTTGPDQ